LVYILPQWVYVYYFSRNNLLNVERYEYKTAGTKTEFGMK